MVEKMARKGHLSVAVASAEEEVLSGTTDCRWCEEENEYEVRTETGEEVTIRCSNCSLKVWIRGDGWEKYKDLHGLEEGCQKEESSSNSDRNSLWDARATWTVNNNDTHSYTDSAGSTPDTHNRVIQEAARDLLSRNRDE